MTFSIKSYIAKSGERFSLLFSADEPGIPLFYPSAFLSRRLRENNTHQTQLVGLDAIRRLCEWERDRGLCLEDRLLRGELLSNYQIDDLAAHVMVSRNNKRGESISAAKFNGYWHYITAYICWLTDELLPNRNNKDMRLLVNDQEKNLKNKNLKRTGSKARKNQLLLEEKLSEKARDKLLNIFSSPFQGVVGTENRATRLRSVLMLRILYETGMRRGELLSLKLKSFVEASGSESAFLIIERNHSDEYDRRVNQPVAKTLGRSVAISESLEAQLIEYRTNYRSEVPNIGFNDHDFIFCVHRRGKTQGNPLSINGFNSTFLYFRNLFPDLGNALHPHAFRHDWNYRFSLLADSKGLSEEKEAESRETLMGWNPGSDMAKVYNKRHRKAQAMQIGREIARDTERPQK
ncbi:site-specific integrase [Pseudomonas soli]|uniref:site-specific integrase n=1 Tax=Pseudomonas soli TaxID=1306993 RepID=UPI00380B6023